ncbi:hypothetical protein [Nocardioides convexus]|uniref:hypothetical protein n=1 Tax=Nocardioides convexus TaxID=2712224 RepID=UPI0024183D3C|nr:hypothetical protein [Nocardioides convexus]
MSTPACRRSRACSRSPSGCWWWAGATAYPVALHLRGQTRPGPRRRTDRAGAGPDHR